MVITGTITILLLLLSLIFLIRKKIIGIMSLSLRVGFPILLIVALSALFVPQIYNVLANFTLRQTGTLESIRRIDNNINPVGDAAEELYQDIVNVFSEDSEDDQGEDQNDQDNGYLESSVYDQLVAALSYIYRLLTLTFSITGMIVIIYLSYITNSAAMGTIALEGKIENLEKRLAKLEQNN